MGRGHEAVVESPLAAGELGVAIRMRWQGITISLSAIIRLDQGQSYPLQRVPSWCVAALFYHLRSVFSLPSVAHAVIDRSEVFPYNNKHAHTHRINKGDIAVKFSVEKNGWYRISAKYTATGRRNQEGVLLDGECLSNLFLPREKTETDIVTIELAAGEHELVLDHRDGDGVLEQLIVEPCAQPAPLPAPHLALSNPNASENAKKLMSYLGSVYGKKVITGQHTKDIPMGEIEYIHSVTGDKPALCGFELLGYSPNIQWETSDKPTVEEARNNQNTISCAIRWAEQEHGIVAYCWHWFSPLGGNDKAFYTEHTDFDCAKAVTPGTPEYEAAVRDIDEIAGHLKAFAEKDIPILWRPLHEAEGGWFWWGAKGAEPCKKLWRLMYDRMVHRHHLNNLIWVWNSLEPEWYPGNDCVDIIGADLYTKPGNPGCCKCDFDMARALPGEGRMIALTECGANPDPDNAIRKGAPWLWTMTWCGGFVTGGEWNTPDQLRAVYASPSAVTLSSLPRLW